MFRVECDQSAEERALRDAEEAFDDLEQKMMRIVRRAETTELTTKKYVDRTGRMRSHTKAVLMERDKDRIDVSFVMDTEYASYLIRRGFSNWDEVTSAATAEMDAVFAEIDRATEE